MKTLNLRKAFTAVLLMLLGAALVCMVQGGGSLKEGLEGLYEKVVELAEGSYAFRDTGEDLEAWSENKAEESPEVTPSASISPFPADVYVPQVSQEPQESESIVVMPTTIKGGMAVRNDTDLQVDLQGLLLAGPSQKLPKTGRGAGHQPGPSQPL